MSRARVGYRLRRIVSAPFRALRAVGRGVVEFIEGLVDYP